MLKKYRLRKLNEKLNKYKAEYSELARIMSTVTETNGYYIDKLVKYKGIISEVESRIMEI